MPSENKKFADKERIKELARNERSSAKPYDINSVVGKDGTPIDQRERATELARSKFNKNKPYDTNYLDS